jgi:hypothetical protein
LCAALHPELERGVDMLVNGLHQILPLADWFAIHHENAIPWLQTGLLCGRISDHLPDLWQLGDLRRRDAHPVHTSEDRDR